VAVEEEAFNVVRLEHGKPRYGEEISERYLAQEVNRKRQANSIPTTVRQPGA
jgi:hypothetical protein